MPDTNLPDKKGTGGDDALSYDDGANAINDLLGDPEADPDEEDRGPEAEDEDEAESEDAEDGESEEEESEDEADADEEDPVEGEDDDGSGEESSGGRFVSGDAKFTLEDGTVTTVAELARNNLFQRDYTQKTQALKEERETFEQQKGQVDQTARQMQAQRDFLLQAAQQLLPKPPDKSMIDSDFFGYQHALADYQEKQQMLNQLQQQSQAEQARLQQEQQQARQSQIDQEAQKLVEAMPELKKPETYRKFWGDAVETMTEYGFTAQEMDQALDHRFFTVFRDLMELKRIKSAAPKAKQKTQSRPVMKGRKRMDPKAKTSREKTARNEQLRKSGDFDAGVSALMDLDL